MTNNNPDIQSHAEDYRLKGWSIIPIPAKQKSPAFKWIEYQKRKPENSEIKKWFGSSQNTNIAVICGEISGGLVVLDIDPRNGGNESIKGKSLPLTPTVKTGGGGFHYYFISSVPIKKTKLMAGVDLQAEGSFVIAPPSLHHSGEHYAWADGRGLDNELAVVPGWILEIVHQKGMTKQQNNSISEAVHKLITPCWKTGDRNNLTLYLAGYLAKQGWSQEQVEEVIKKLAEDDEELLKRLDTVERTCQRLKAGDPVQGYVGLKDLLPEDILTALTLLTEKEEKTKEGKTIASKIAALAISTVLFENEYQESFASVPVNNHREIWPCKSRGFHRWLTREYNVRFGGAPDPASLKTALGLIEAKAHFGGLVHPLNNRVAWHDKAVWHDLTDNNWRAVKITTDGWSIVNNPPILFRRYSHQNSQVEPICGGNLQEILRFFNIQDKNLEILLLVYIVSCLVPDIPHPISLFYGEQGSAKSTQHRLIKTLLDPSKLEINTLPREGEPLSQLLSHHWLVFFDNLSALSDKASDALCRAVSGEGFTKRQLYTDDEDIIYQYKRCIGLNGINAVIEKPDLLERTLLFRLQRIPPEKRRDEARIWNEFQKERPRLLGAAFTVLVSAIKIRPTIKLASVPRMADFVLWGCAISKSLGYTQDEFLQAYLMNQNTQHEEILESNNLASVLIQFMQNENIWTGTASELLGELSILATEQQIDVKTGDWPKGPPQLTKRLNILKTNLREMGLEVSTSQQRRGIIITKTRKNTVQTVPQCQKTSEAYGEHGAHGAFLLNKGLDKIKKYFFEKKETCE